MEFERFSHVSIVISDIAKAKKFYGQVLGLKEIPRPEFPFEGAWYSLGQEVQLHLIQANSDFRWAKGSTQNPARNPHFALWVKDADTTYEQLKTRDCSIMTQVAITGLRQIFVMDNDKNMVELIGPTKETRASTLEN